MIRKKPRGSGVSVAPVFRVRGPSPSDFSEAGYSPWSWYPVSEIGEDGLIEGGFVTYDQGELLRYFAEREAHGERLGLIKVSSTHADLLEEENHVVIIYVLTRDAEDLDPGLGGPAHSLRQGRHQLRESTDLCVEHVDEKGRR